MCYDYEPCEPVIDIFHPVNDVAVAKLIIKNSVDGSMITTEHIARCYDIDAEEIYKFIFHHYMRDSYDEIPSQYVHTYELLEEVGFICYKGVRCPKSLRWTPKGVSAMDTKRSPISC